MYEAVRGETRDRSVPLFLTLPEYIAPALREVPVRDVAARFTFPPIVL